MLSDADYKALKEFDGVVFDDNLLGSEGWVRMERMKKNGFVSMTYTELPRSPDPNIFLPPASPVFKLLPAGIDAIREYEAHKNEQKTEDKRRKSEILWNRGLAILALVISIIALLKQ